MNYYLNLFTLDTWQGFLKNGANLSGFRERQASANKVKPGDIFLCYIVGISRWCGALEVTSELFRDTTPIYSNPDPYILRFQVDALVSLDPEHSLPMLDDHIWDALEETKGLAKGASGWAVKYRTSLRQLSEHDGMFLLQKLRQQLQSKQVFPFSEREFKHLARKRTVQTLTGPVSIEVPDDSDEEVDATVESTVLASKSEHKGENNQTEVRQSIRIQAALAEIGAKMNFHIWIPASDRSRVLEIADPSTHEMFLEALPLNYDENTLDTIRQIDVLWLKGRSMARAFEVEHTTAIYSGILRMADLLALQPNMQIRLHIVAPNERREKVIREIKRPVFSLLEHGPLYNKCSYLSYDSIIAIAKERFLSHMSDSVLDEYEERIDDD